MASTVWKGQLSFGFISLAVKFTSAARAESVSFNQLHTCRKSAGEGQPQKDLPEHSRVGQTLVCKHEDRMVDRGEIVKGYEYEKDKYIVIAEEEIDQLTPETADSMEVLEFVSSEAVDAVFFEHSYYLAPEKGGEKSYALLHQAMAKTGMLAITRIAMHSREHVAVLRPGTRGIVLQTLFYHDEVRAVNEFRTDTELVNARDVEMAAKLVESLSAPWEPEKYKDGYREKLAELVQAKVTGKPLAKGQKKGRKSQVVDIQDALRMSIENAKSMKKKPAMVGGKK